MGVDDSAFFYDPRLLLNFSRSLYRFCYQLYVQAYSENVSFIPGEQISV